jgi:hypothetical protein
MDRIFTMSFCAVTGCMIPEIALVAVHIPDHLKTIPIPKLYIKSPKDYQEGTFTYLFRQTTWNVFLNLDAYLGDHTPGTIMYLVRNLQSPPQRIDKLDMTMKLIN